MRRKELSGEELEKARQKLLEHWCSKQVKFKAAFESSQRSELAILPMWMQKFWLTPTKISAEQFLDNRLPMDIGRMVEKLDEVDALIQ